MRTLVARLSSFEPFHHSQSFGLSGNRPSAEPLMIDSCNPVWSPCLLGLLGFSGHMGLVSLHRRSLALKASCHHRSAGIRVLNRGIVFDSTGQRPSPPIGLTLSTDLSHSVSLLISPNLFSSSSEFSELKEVNGLPGSCSGNLVGNRVVFGFKVLTQLIIGSGSC